MYMITLKLYFLDYSLENEAERQNYELEAERVRQEMNARLGTSNEGMYFLFIVMRREGEF